MALLIVIACADINITVSTRRAAAAIASVDKTTIASKPASWMIAAKRNRIIPICHAATKNVTSKNTYNDAETARVIGTLADKATSAQADTQVIGRFCAATFSTAMQIKTLVDTPTTMSGNTPEVTLDTGMISPVINPIVPATYVSRDVIVRFSSRATKAAITAIAGIDIAHRFSATA
jgi:hypothetical protein